MNDRLQLLLKSTLQNDSSYGLKRIEIKNWYKIYGNKIICGEKQDEIVTFLSSSFKEERFWSNNNTLNTSMFIKYLLSKRDEVPFHQGYDLYEIACLVCSEEDIRAIFTSLDINLESFVCESFNWTIHIEEKLMKFWSHYINVVGIESPNPFIRESFKKLLFSYDKNSSIDNMSDIWKCGFECAKQEGCEEALDFFWSKLENEYKGEREKQLINIGVLTYARRLYDSGMRTYYHEERNINVIKFVLKYLQPDAYRSFMEEDRKIHRGLRIIHSLIDNFLYLHAKQMISALGSSNISHDEYDLIYSCKKAIQDLPHSLLDLYVDFFIWLWRNEDLQNHRQVFLTNKRNLFSLSHRLSSALPLSIMVLESATGAQIKESITEYGASELCTILYVENKRDVIIKYILHLFPHGDKLLPQIDKLVYSEIKKNASGIDAKYASELLIQGKREELIKCIERVMKSDRCRSLLYEIEYKICLTFSRMFKTECGAILAANPEIIPMN